MTKGILIVISAPSGAGKTTLVRELHKIMPEVLYTISLTTRSPRRGEKNGEDYHYVTPEEFKKKVAENDFIEYAEVHGYWYGTPKSFVDESLKKGKVILLDIDVQGGRQIKKIYPESVLVFVAPPSLEVLESRLRARGQDDEKTIQKRLKNAIQELDQSKYYDYLIVNDEIPHAVDQLRGVIIAEKSRMKRTEFKLSKVLNVQ